jgi:plastocyanin
MLAACGDETGDGGNGDDVQADHEVIIENFTYDPASLTINVGETVRWINRDSVSHTVTAGAPGARTDEFDSGSIAPDQSFVLTFEQVGTFDYFCTFHPVMTAVVTVE